MNYVMGLSFDHEWENVLLIKKNRPAWQAGNLNGLGGKIENGDHTREVAMSREFYEECGIDIGCWCWEWFATIDLSVGSVFCFWENETFSSRNLGHLKSLDSIEQKTDEEVGWYNISEVLKGEHPTVPNIPCLVYLAIDQSEVNDPWRIRTEGK